MNSPFLTLNSRDFTRGLFVAVLTAVVTFMYTSLQTGSLTFDWKAIGMAALSSALAYIMKNLLTNSNDELLKSESIIDNEKK
jgi:uncharacterized membrane protein YvlD (DUF360 family)